MSQTIQIHGRPVRFESSVHPDKEADRLLEGLPFTSCSLVLLFGCSTRALLERILSRIRPGTMVLCVDPDAQLHDLLPAEFRKRAAFRTISEAERIISLLEDHFYRQRKGAFRHLLVRNPNIVRHYAAEYDALERTLSPVFHDLYRNMLVLKKFGRLWLRNIDANITASRARGLSLSAWKDRWKDRPAIIVCAGPSLDRNLPRMTGLKEKFVIVCVDTALIPLLKHGIVPDIVVSLDSQIANVADFFDPLVLSSCSSTDLVMEITAHRSIPGLFPGGLLPFHTVKLLTSPETGTKAEFVEPHYRAFTSAFRNTEGLQTGGSVSTTALDLCLLCGFSKVVFIGQDLGFLDYRLYCRGTYADRVLSLRENRFVPRSNSLLKHMSASDRPLSITAEGQVYRSSPVMDGYRRWLENALLLLKGKALFCEAPWLSPSDNAFISFEELERFPAIPPQVRPRIRLEPADPDSGTPFTEETRGYLGLS